MEQMGNRNVRKTIKIMMIRNRAAAAVVLVAGMHFSLLTSKTSVRSGTKWSGEAKGKQECGKAVQAVK